MNSLVYPKWLEDKWQAEKEAEKIKQEYVDYYKNHKACPQCGKTDICSTTGPWGPTPYQRGIDRNKAWCDCGWKGIVDDLVTPIVAVYNLEETPKGQRCVCKQES